MQLEYLFKIKLNEYEFSWYYKFYITGLNQDVFNDDLAFVAFLVNTIVGNVAFEIRVVNVPWLK